MRNKFISMSGTPPQNNMHRYTLLYAIILKELNKTHSENVTIALAGVAQWIESRPVERKVAGSVPGQGTCRGCRLGPQLGACDRQPIDIFLAQ